MSTEGNVAAVAPLKTDMRADMMRNLLAAAVVASVALILQIAGTPYVVYVANLAMIYALLSVGLNLLIGYCGQVSVGHAAFFGIGAYTSAIFSVDFHLSFWSALPLAMLVSALAGLVLGLPALRLRGHYLILVTLGFGEIVRIILQNWQPVTKGPTGISAIPPVNVLGFTLDNEKSFFFLALAFLLIGLWVAHRIIDSRTGRELVSVRDNELAAELMGVDTIRVKLFAFVISAAYAGVAGSLYAHMSGYISPDVFTFEVSVAVLIMVMLGGAGTRYGPLLGALVLTALPEMLREFKQLYLFFYGVGILMLAVFLPRGVAGLFKGRAKP
jgi:branched-chain amino acid transport system permease protein